MSIRRARFATAPVVAAMAALAVGLLLLIGSYGYHRDELYIRLLPSRPTMARRARGTGSARTCHLS